MSLVRNNIDKIWYAQLAMFVLGGLMWWVLPAFTFDPALKGCYVLDPHVKVLGIDAVMLLGPFSLAMAYFTVLAQRSDSARFKRDMSRIFALFLGPWIGVVIFNITNHFGAIAIMDPSMCDPDFVAGDTASNGGALAIGLAIPAGALFGCNVIMALGSYDPDPGEPPSGLLGSLWKVQALVIAPWGLALMFLSGFCASQVAEFPIDLSDWTNTRAIDQFRMVSPYYVGLGGMSALAAMMPASADTQRDFARGFLGWFVLWGATLAWVYDSTEHTAVVLGAMTVVGVFAVANAVFAFKR